jgi:hypothetical protein
MTNSSRVKFLFFMAAAVSLAACGHKNVKAQAGIPTPMASGPAWVNQGSGAFKDGSFYGVGVATGIRNRALAVDTADSRARAKIAEVFSTYIAKLNKDYMASTTAGDMKSSSEEQNVTQTLKSFTEMTLSGAAPVDHWVDPSDGSMYSLVKLDLSAVKNQLDGAKELNAQVRDYVKANADKAFNDLSAEEAKHN